MLSIFLLASDVFGGKPRLVVVLLLQLETSCGRLSWVLRSSFAWSSVFSALLRRKP